MGNGLALGAINYGQAARGHASQSMSPAFLKLHSKTTQYTTQTTESLVHRNMLLQLFVWDTYP